MANDQSHDTRTTVAEDRVAAAVSLSVAARAAIGGQGDFYDDFEGGQSAETDFFMWKDHPRSEVVSTGQALSGSESLRFTYQGNATLGGGGDPALWSEKEFQIKENLTDLWLQYYEYIPLNYHHRGTSENGGRKVLAIFSDDYSNSGPDGVSYPTFIIGASPYGTSKPGSSYLDFAFQSALPGGSIGSRQFDLTGIAEANYVLIDLDIDLGHWQRRTLHIRQATTQEAQDGILELWVQRHAELSSPMTEEKPVSRFDIKFYDPNRNYLNGGYLLGYANAGFEETTEFYIDNFAIGSSAESIGRGDLA